MYKDRHIGAPNKIHSYYNQLREALRERREAPLPGVSWIVLAGIVCTLAYIGLAMVVVPSNEPREYHFVNEEGAITALGTTLIRARVRHASVWILFAIGFAFLSLDELLQFHERAD